MVGIVWNAQQRSYEWEVAKKKLTDSNGWPLPNGTKLSRKTSGLSHSFMIIDNRILALNEKGAHIGSGVTGHAKLAEDERGRLFALKISKENLSKESDISSDLHIAGKTVTRKGAGKRKQDKHYVAYKYLGMRFDDYFIARRDTLSLDERYELCTKVALALHALQTGSQSKTKTSYVHGDFHAGNIVIDDNHNIHIIDFGLSQKGQEADQANIDTRRMLDYFYTHAEKREMRDNKDKHFWGVLGDVMPPEYRLYLSSSEWLEKFIAEYQLILNQDPSFLQDSKYTTIGYALRDSTGEIKKGTIELSQLGIEPFSWKFESALDDDEIEKLLIQRKNKILEIIVTQHGDVINYSKKNHLLLNRLNNRQSTAFEMAETFTLCRFNLESHQDMLTQHSVDERLIAVEVLNSQSKLIFELYNQIRALPGAQDSDFEKNAKTFLLNQALSQKTKTSASHAFNQLFSSLDQSQGALAIKECLGNLVDRMEQEKKLITHAKSFTTLVDDILSLKKHRGTDVKDKLDALNSDLYAAGKIFFDQKYVSSDERGVAFKLFKETCEALVTQAEKDFSDKPGTWPKLKSVLNKILGVVLAIVTLSAAIYLFNGLETYKVRFFNSPPMSKVWNDADVKNSLFAAKKQEKPGLFTQIEEDITITPKKS